MIQEIKYPRFILYRLMSLVPAFEVTPFQLKIQKRKIIYRSILWHSCAMLCETEMDPIEKKLMRHEETRDFLEKGFVYQDEHIFLNIGPGNEFLILLY